MTKLTLINQSINQSIDQSINQSISQSSILDLKADMTYKLNFRAGHGRSYY